MADRIDVNSIIDPKVKKELISIQNEMKKLVDMTKQLASTSKQLDTELKKGATTQAQVAAAKKTTADNTKKLSDVEREANKIQKQYSDAMAKSIAMADKNIQKIIQETDQKKKQNNITKATLLANNQLRGSYNQIQAALTANTLKYKNLTQAERENNKIGGQLLNTIKKQQTELTKMDAKMKVFGRNVGNYGSAFKGLAGSLRSLAFAFGATGGLFMFVNLLKSSFNKIKEFDKAMSGLKAVANATDKEMSKLRKSAIELGAVTPKTATEVAQLQTEFAKLGFTTREILAATQATINLSIAAGTDLANAASIAGTTLRGFGLDATETQRVVDVMTKSFSTSALDVSNFSEAMKYVAPVAKAAGFSIEETTAMLAKLADAGIRGSMAGTSLRMIMLKQAQAGMKGMDGFNKMARAGISLAEANDEVGQRAQTALLVLSEQKDRVAELTDVYNNAEGAAQKMADTMADNLAGDIDIAKSAWERLIFSVDSGRGKISKASRSIVQSFTKIVNALADWNKTSAEITEEIKDFTLKKQTDEDIKAFEKLGEKHLMFLEQLKKEYEQGLETLMLREKNLDKEKEDIKIINAVREAIKLRYNVIEDIETRILQLKDYAEEKARKEAELARKIADEKAKAAAEELAAIKEKQQADDEYAKQAKMYKDYEIKRSKEIHKEVISDIEKELQIKLNALTEEYIQGKITTEQLLRETLNLQIKYNEEKIDYLKENGQEVLEIETGLLNIKKDLYDLDYENFKENEDKKRFELTETQKVLADILNETLELGKVVGDREIEQLEIQKEREIALAGQSAKAKETIETQYAKKIADIKKKQAIADKLQALFNIAINTSVAYVQALPNLLLANLILLLGGIQGATVLAQPIPKFYKGVENFTGGFATVGEQGAELIETPQGVMLSPDRATTMMLPKGTNVYTKDETKAIIQKSNIDVSELVKEQKLTRKALTNKTEQHTSITDKGMKYMIRKNNQRITFIDKYIRS